MAVTAALTASVTTALTLDANTASPLYDAVTGWLPSVSPLVVTPACPFTRVPVPSSVAPSAKVTVPVGVPIPPETVAVKLTALPSKAGLGVATRSVVVGAALTV